MCEYRHSTYRYIRPTLYHSHSVFFFFVFRQIEKRLEFEKRRKLHYNEFEAVRRARQLMEQDEDNDDEDVENDHSNISATGNDNNMDMDDDDTANKLGSRSSTSSAAEH